jgi:hypothetical protein
MRTLALILAASLAGPVVAQAPETPDCPFYAPGCERLPRLLEQFEREVAPLLRDLEREVGPLMEGLGQRVDPMLRELADLLGDLSGWEAPEVLPNGDILIRRRPRPEGQPPEAPPPVTAPFEL